MTARTAPDRLESIDWEELRSSLDQAGYAVTPAVLSPAECEALAGLYDEDRHWRSRVDMARHRFGSGEYKYFARPLPEVVSELRAAFYPRLAPVANGWNERLGIADRYPERLDDFLDRCHAAGQARPTPLILRYGPGDYNCLHQDIYGEHAFPLQLMVMLSRRDDDYTGGEFLLVENLPRAQSRGTAITLRQGEAVIWPVRVRPGAGSRGSYRIGVRHGVSVVRAGRRQTLGVIFHDAA
jgi:hypothetical protein